MIAANEQSLREFHPELRNALSEVREIQNVEITPSRRGPATLVWIDAAGKRKYLNSPTDPAEEAKKIAGAALQNSSADAALLIGHGAGYEIRELAKRSQLLFVLVPNLPLLRFLCDRLDLSDLFMNSSIRWIFGNPAQARARLDSMPKNVDVVIHPPFLDTFPPEFSELLAAVKQIHSGRETEDILRPVAEENLRENVGALAAPGVASVFGCARGRPVVVAAAGPSLDESISAIKDCLPYSYLIAADTVAEGLAEQGLSPDFVVSVDPNPESCMHFQNDAGCGAAILVFTPISQPKVVRQFSGRRLLAIPKNHFFLQPAQELLAGKGLLIGGGSVSILASSLAAAMEPSHIILAGVDFRTAPGRVYSGLSSYHRQIAGSGRYSTPETTERSFLSGELIDTPAGKSATRLKHYAADFRFLVKHTPVPFYSLGPAPVEGVRTGGLPCVRASVTPRPVRVPPDEPRAHEKLFTILGMLP